jgi:hydrogenase maturation protease
MDIGCDHHQIKVHLRAFERPASGRVYACNMSPPTAEGPGSCRTLVIGYGSTLRSDDGAGPRAAEALSTRALPGVRVTAVHQLTPDVAGTLAEFDRVVFVDATVLPDSQPRLERVEPAASESSLGHFGSPQTMLALAKAAFGRCPEAWLLTIPGEYFEIGETLTPLAEQGVARAVDMIIELLDSWKVAP